MAKEKKTDLGSVISSLKKDFGASFPDAVDAGTVKRLTLTSPKLNFIFGGGGYPKGRIVELYGPPSGGKTVLASYIGGQFQKQESKNLVVFVDFEKTFEWNYAKVVGLSSDESKLIYMSPLTGEEAFTYCQSLVETGEIGLIIWDSIAATPTATNMEDEYNKAGFGQTAKLFSDGLRKLNPYLSRYGTSLILLNQVRDKIGGFNPGYGVQENTNGGQSIKFYASWRARVSKTEDILLNGEIIGNKIRVKNMKSKIGYPKRSIEIDLYYNSGFNSDSEYLEFFLQLGIVERKGGWYSSEEWGMKVQGSDKVLAFLYENPDKFETAKAQVNEIFTKYSVLDSDTEDEPDEEQGD